MNAAIAWMNAISDPWSHLMLRASLEGAIALTLAWLLALACRSARLKCWWWRLAHLKLLLTLACLTPLALPLLPAPKPIPLSITSPQSPPSPTARANMLSPTPALASIPNIAPIHERPSPQSLLLILWLIGLTLSTFHLAHTWHRTHRLRRTALPLQHPTLTAAAHRIAQTLHLRTPAALLTSPNAQGPLLTGTLHPVILLPTPLLTACSPHTLELILTHELAHLARRDLWWNWLCSLAAIPFFFHPAVWLARREWFAAQELACDELTLAAANATPADYARTLLEVLTHCRPTCPATTLFTAGIGTLTTTKRRMKAMHNLPARSNRSLTFAAVACASIAVIGLIPWRVVAQSPSAPAKNTESIFAQPSTPTTASSPAVAHPPTDEAHLMLSGQLTADSFTITQMFDGIPVKVNVTEGAHVKQGDPLIAFYDADFQRALAIANLQLDDAKNKSQIGAGTEDAMKLAEIARDKAAEDLAKTKMVSPLDGIVSESNAKVGQFVTKGTPLITIVDTSKLMADTWVSQMDLAKIHVGQKTVITTPAYPDTKFAGEITYIAPTVDVSQGLCVVKASVKGDIDKLKPGMTVLVELIPD